MRIIGTIIALCVTFCLAGCFTIDSSTVRDTHEQHVVVENYGWYLFDFIPLACGNASEYSWTPWAIFRNDVTMDKVQRRFMDYAAQFGCEPSDLAYRNVENVLFEIPGLSFPLPIPYLFTYHEIQLSGVLR